MLERLNDILKAKANAKADLLGIDRRLFRTAIDQIAASRLDGKDLADLDRLNGEIIDAYIKSLIDAFTYGSTEDLHSDDEIRRRDAIIGLEYLTAEQIEELPTAPQVKQLLRQIEQPQKLHAIAIATALEDLRQVHLQYKPKSLAEVALERAGEEINLFYDSVSLRIAGVNESEIMRRLNTL